MLHCWKQMEVVMSREIELFIFPAMLISSLLQFPALTLWYLVQQHSYEVRQGIAWQGYYFFFLHLRKKASSNVKDM